MKVLAQSTIAPSVPYLHLGYFSATVFTPLEGLHQGGWAGVLLGVALLWAAAVSLVVGQRRRIPRARLWGWGLLTASVLVIGLGISGIALAVRRGETSYAFPEHVTRSRARAILEYVQAHQETSRSAPADFVQSRRETPTPEEDAWHRPMRLVAESASGQTVFTVVSAGPDGQFGTADDIRAEQSAEF